VVDQRGDEMTTNDEKPNERAAGPEWAGGASAGPGSGAGTVRLNPKYTHEAADADQGWEVADESWANHSEIEGEPGTAARPGLVGRLKRFFGAG
jgi:hypothetical protein